MAITEHMAGISGHMTVTSGNVSHPEDEAIVSLVFWSAIRALILVSSEDLEADQIKKNHPFGQFKRYTSIRRATKSKQILLE